MAIATKAALDAAVLARYFFYAQLNGDNTVGNHAVLGGPRSGATYFAPWGVISAAAASAGGTLFGRGNSGFVPLRNAHAWVHSFNWCDTTWQSQVQRGRVWLCDFVWGASGFLANTTSAQAVTGFPTLTRPDANGTGLEFLFMAGTVANVATLGITVSYTNEAGTSGRTATWEAGLTTAFSNASEARWLKLQAGDKGVQSVQSLTQSLTNSSAGDHTLFLVRKLCRVQQMEYGSPRLALHDAFRLGMPSLGSDCALGLVAGYSVGTPQTAKQSLCELVIAHG